MGIMKLTLRIVLDLHGEIVVTLSQHLDSMLVVGIPHVDTTHLAKTHRTLNIAGLNKK